MEPATLIRDYKLDPLDHNLVKIPKGALILEVGYRETHHVVLTVQCLRSFTFGDLEERHFRIFETGQDLPNVGLVYIGSYHVPRENQNYYLYEDFNTQKEKPSNKDFSSRQKTATPLTTTEEQSAPHILPEVKQVIWDKIKVLMYDDKKEKRQSFECSVDVASLGIHSLDIEKGYGYDEQEAFANYMKELETHQAQINNLVAMLKAKQCDLVPIGGDGTPLKTSDLFK